MGMEHEYFTSIVEEFDGFFVGMVLEVPGALGYGKTREELKTDLLNAIKALQKSKRKESEINLKHSFLFNETSERHRLSLCC